MAVRNFYVRATVDGRAKELTGGPQAKNGGMFINLYQRDDGQIKTVFSIGCTERDGVLVSRVYNSDGVKVAEFESRR